MLGCKNGNLKTFNAGFCVGEFQPQKEGARVKGKTSRKGHAKAEAQAHAQVIRVDKNEP